MPTDCEKEPVAPWWHAVLVLIPVIVGSVASAWQHGLPNANFPGINSRLSSYFTLLLAEWLVVFLIWLALRRRHLSLASLTSGHWPTPLAFFRDLGVAIGFLIVAIPTVGVLINALGGGVPVTLAHITPQTGFELLVWLALSITGGYCEELVFRGYFTRQFSAWTGSRMFAVFLQGVLFGLAHGYYGKAMVVVMVQGWLLGLLAWWRKSLRPGMLAHGLQDGLGGVIAFFK